MKKVVKDLTVLGIKAGLATAPFCGGIAEIFGWITEGRFVERRLSTLETLLENDADTFLKNIKDMDEHDFYALRKLLKFHCFEAMPELTDITAKTIIDYAMNKQTRTGDDQVIEILCQLNASDIHALKEIKKAIIEKGDGDYTKIIEWSDVSPFRHSDPQGSIKLSKMLVSTFENSDGSDATELSASLNSLAVSFSKLNKLNVICAYHQIYAGMNNDLDVDQFVITPFGVKILNFIDLD